MPCDGHSLGVIAAESRMAAGDRLKPVDERLAGEPGADPIVGVRHGADVDSQECADSSDAEEDGTTGQRYAVPLRASGRGLIHRLRLTHQPADFL
jgi:hypothetical protein